MVNDNMEGLNDDIQAHKLGRSRRRASKACLKCRRRKVRCDVTRTSYPCTNCRLDNVTCSVIPRSSHHKRSLNTSSTTIREAPDELNVPVEDSSSVSPEAFLTMESLNAMEETRISNWAPMAASNADTSTTFDDPDFGTQSDYVEDLYSLLSPASGHAAATHGIRAPEYMVEVSLDRYYRRLQPRDISHLKSQGCFRLPATPILAEFLRHYFMHIHPMLPILREGDFWNTGYADATSNQSQDVPLLLLQAMLFASCSFASQETVRMLGFPNMKAAKYAFYTKAKLLFDFSIETDQIAVSQAALLLTYWCPALNRGAANPNGEWLKKAIALAKAVGADRYAIAPADTDAQRKKRNIYKRLWWGCIVRDRIMRMCVRQSIRITRSEFDFESNAPLGYDDLVDELDRSKVYSCEMKHSLTTVTALMIELCVILTDVLEMVYPSMDMSVSDMDISGKRMDALQRNREALHTWFSRASRVSPAFNSAAQGPNTQMPEAHPLILYANLIRIYCYSARVALCNYELHCAVLAAQARRNTWQHLATIENNRKELWDATSGITDCLDELLELRIAHWLPNSAVACTALPLALHLLDIRLSSPGSSHPNVLSSNPRIAKKQKRLHTLIRAMKEYRPKYDGVDWLSKTIRYFMECTYLDEPVDSVWDPAFSNPLHQAYDSDEDEVDILRKNPTCYLRLTLTIDLSLSKNRLPEEKDFPTKLRGLIQKTGCFIPTLFGQDDDNSSVENPSSLWWDKAGVSSVKPSLPFEMIDSDNSLFFAREMGLLELEGNPGIGWGGTWYI